MTTLHATFIGTATVLFEFRRANQVLRLLTDPVFDGPGASYRVGGVGALRYTSLGAPALRPEELPPIDAVLLSHDHHGDNLDSAGRRVAASAKQVLTTRAGATRLGRAGLQHVRGLDPWSTTEVRSEGAEPFVVRVTATPARHGPPLSLPLVGHVIGFLVEWANQERGPLWIFGRHGLAPRARADRRAQHRHRLLARGGGGLRPRTRPPVHDERGRRGRRREAPRGAHHLPDSLRGLEPLQRGPRPGRDGVRGRGARRPLCLAPARKRLRTDASQVNALQQGLQAAGVKISRIASSMKACALVSLATTRLAIRCATSTGTLSDTAMGSPSVTNAILTVPVRLRSRQFDLLEGGDLAEAALAWLAIPRRPARSWCSRSRPVSSTGRRAAGAELLDRSGAVAHCTRVHRTNSR